MGAAANPARQIDRYPEKGRERFLTPDELRRLGKAMRDAETVGLPWLVDEGSPSAKHIPKNKRSRVIDPHAVAAIRLLMLTGARLREILNARWDYLDLDRGLMFLPDSKTGRKTIYLNDAALGLLTDVPRLKGNPYIIPGSNKGQPRADLKRPWAAILLAAGLADAQDAGNPKGKGDKGRKRRSKEQPGLRIHDLRHTFASLGVGISAGTSQWWANSSVIPRRQLRSDMRILTLTRCTRRRTLSAPRLKQRCRPPREEYSLSAT